MSISSKNKKGFTIIEAMVAIFVLTLGIVAVLCLFPLSLQTRKFSEMKTVASQLAQAKIEEIAIHSYDDIPIGTIDEGQLDSPFGAYTRQLVVNYVDSDLQSSASNIGLKKIEVTVSWSSPLLISPKSVNVLNLITGR